MTKRSTAISPTVFDLLPSERIVMIGGSITDETVAEVTPRILELLADPTTPIAVVLHSPGGSLHAFENLSELLGLKTPREDRPEIITFTAGTAASAAALLLTSGDCAAALPAARIHFHGVRTADPEITEADAADHNTSLHEINTERAVWLASRMLPRMLDTHEGLSSDDEDLEKLVEDLTRDFEEPDQPGLKATARLAAAIHLALPEGLDEIVTDAWAEIGTLQAVRKAAEGDVHAPCKGALAAIEDRDETQRLEIEHKLRVMNGFVAGVLEADPDSTLEFEDLVHIVSQIEFYAAWSSPHFQDELLFTLAEQGEKFFEPKELETARRIAIKNDRATPKEIEKFDQILESVYRRAEPLWAFTLAIARALQQYEVSLSAESAWWLGLLDVVVGTELDRRASAR